MGAKKVEDFVRLIKIWQLLKTWNLEIMPWLLNGTFFLGKNVQSQVNKLRYSQYSQVSLSSFKSIEILMRRVVKFRPIKRYRPDYGCLLFWILAHFLVELMYLFMALRLKRFKPFYNKRPRQRCDAPNPLFCYCFYLPAILDCWVFLCKIL